MNFENNYRKGFTNKDIWETFRGAIGEADCDAIEDALKAQMRESGVEGIIAVDPDIFSTSSPDLHLLEDFPVETYDIGSAEHEVETRFVMDLADHRDTPLHGLVNIPESLTTVSWFLRDEIIHRYAPRKDFGGDEESYLAIQKGAPIEMQTNQGRRNIQTGRDCARFVHDDNPLTIFVKAVADLLALGVEYKVCPGQVRDSVMGRFASTGAPFLFGGLGQVMYRVGLISFREKWGNFFPRPEQAAVDFGLGFCTTTFAEGSPMHPSRNAMHQIIYEAMAGYVLYLFDDFFELPNGNTVGDEVSLLSANGGDWRVWAGVHYMSDNGPYKERARALGEKIAKEMLGED